MGKGSAPAAPNYSGLIQAANDQSARYAKIMDEQLQFSKDAYAHQLPYTDQIQDINLDTAQNASDFAKSQQAQYQQLYQPLAKKFVGEAQDYASPDKVARARGAAMGAVGAQFDAAGEAAKRNLESYGIDPSATRYQALDVGARTAKAAATAAAGTKSDTDRELAGLGLEAQALNIGNGLPGQVATTNNSGTAAGASGVNSGNSTYGAVAGALGNPTAWGGLSTNALGTAGSLTSQGYQASLGQYTANQNSSSGIGSALGAGLGIASMFFEDGGYVPPEMSPSGGAVTDDIPASVDGSPQPQAAINAGEFIMPQRTTNYYGTKHLQGLIDKADAAMGVEPQPSGPELGPAVGGESPPPVQAGALPINPQPQIRMARGGRVPAIGGAGGRFAGGNSRIGAVPARRQMPSPYPGGSGAGAVRSAIPGV